MHRSTIILQQFQVKIHLVYMLTLLILINRSVFTSFIYNLQSIFPPEFPAYHIYMTTDIFYGIFRKFFSFEVTLCLKLSHELILVRQTGNEKINDRNLSS